jgi:hypothetical protein
MQEVIWQNIVALITFILSVVSPHIYVTARNSPASPASDPDRSLWRSGILSWSVQDLGWSIQEVLDLELSAIAGLPLFTADVAELEATTASCMESTVSKRKQDYVLRQEEENTGR